MEPEAIKQRKSCADKKMGNLLQYPKIQNTMFLNCQDQNGLSQCHKINFDSYNHTLLHECNQELKECQTYSYNLPTTWINDAHTFVLTS